MTNGLLGYFFFKELFDIDYFINCWICLLYTSDAADDSLRVDLGGRRIIKKTMFVLDW